MGFADGRVQSLLARKAGAHDDPELVIVDFSNGAGQPHVGAVQAPGSSPIAAKNGAPR